MREKQKLNLEPGDTELFTVKEIAMLLKMSESIVYRLVEERKLACHRVGTGRGRIRIAKVDLGEYLERCKYPVDSQPRRHRTRSRLRHLEL